MGEAIVGALIPSLGNGGGAKGRVGPEWYRALPLAPPPDLPLYLPSPAVRAGVMAKQAATKAEEAVEAARKAVSASAEASAKAQTAEVASARAASINRALVGYGYVDDMVKRLNKTLAQAMYPPDGDAPAVEVREARELVRRSHKLKLMADDDLQSLRAALQHDRKRLDPEVQEAMEGMLSRLRFHQGAVAQIDRTAKKQLKLLEGEEKPEPEAPFLPHKLLLPDGTPRWPSRLPPPELPPQQEMPLTAKRFL